MIDENYIDKLDKEFHVRSTIIQSTDKVLISSGLYQWMIEIIPQQHRNICLSIANKYKNKSSFVIQGFKNNIYQAYKHIAGYHNLNNILYTLPTTYKNNRTKR